MSNVTALQFRDSLFNAFAAFWAGRTQIAAPNVDFDPDKLPAGETAWVRLFILGDPEGGQVRLSSSVQPDHFQRSGTSTVEVYVRQGGDLDEAYTLAEAVMEFLESPGVAAAKFSTLSQPQEFGPDGTWFQVSVSASWLYWTDRAA
jgi:hypothetical protein